MTFLVERLADLRKHLDHLEELRNQISGPGDLDASLTLHNDVLFSLLMVAQLVIDITGELLSRRKERFDDYTDSIRKLGADERFDPDMLSTLRKLPGFRNVLVHDYVGLDLERVVEALNELEPVRRFASVVAEIEKES